MIPPSLSSALSVSKIFGRPTDLSPNVHISTNLIPFDAENCKTLLPWLIATSVDDVESTAPPSYKAVIPSEEWSHANTAIIFRMPSDDREEKVRQCIARIYDSRDLDQLPTDKLVTIASAFDAHIIQLGGCFGGTSFMAAQAVLSFGGALYLSDRRSELRVPDRHHCDSHTSIRDWDIDQISSPINATTDTNTPLCQSPRTLSPIVDILHDGKEVQPCMHKFHDHIHTPHSRRIKCGGEGTKAIRARILSKTALFKDAESMRESTSKDEIEQILSDNIDVAGDSPSIYFTPEQYGICEFSSHTPSLKDKIPQSFLECDTDSDDSDNDAHDLPCLLQKFSLSLTIPSLNLTSTLNFTSPETSNLLAPDETERLTRPVSPVQKHSITRPPTPEVVRWNLSLHSSPSLKFTSQDLSTSDDWLLAEDMTRLRSSGISVSQAFDTFGIYSTDVFRLMDEDNIRVGRSMWQFINVDQDGVSSLHEDEDGTKIHSSADRFHSYLRDMRIHRTIDPPATITNILENRMEVEEDASDDSVIIPQLEWADECIWVPTPVPQRQDARGSRLANSTKSAPSLTNQRHCSLDTQTSCTPAQSLSKAKTSTPFVSKTFVRRNTRSVVSTCVKPSTRQIVHPSAVPRFVPKAIGSSSVRQESTPRSPSLRAKSHRARPLEPKSDKAPRSQISFMITEPISRQVTASSTSRMNLSKAPSTTSKPLVRPKGQTKIPGEGVSAMRTTVHLTKRNTKAPTSRLPQRTASQNLCAGNVPRPARESWTGTTSTSFTNKICHMSRAGRSGKSLDGGLRWKP